MTLSQRLTRAGLTFILLGTVAAAMPQQGGAAIADNPCTKTPPVQLEIRQQSSGTVSSTYTQQASNGNNQFYDAYISTDSGANFFLDANGKISFTNSGNATVTPTSGTSNSVEVLVTTPTTGGIVNLTATDNATTPGITYVATADVTYTE